MIERVNKLKARWTYASKTVLRVLGLNISTIISNHCESRKHILPGYSDVVEPGESVVQRS